QTLHDGRRVHVTRDVHEQRRNRDNAHVVEVHQGLGDHVAPLFQGEERFGLLGVSNGRHDDLVKNLGRALDDLEVTVMERVEGARDESNRHSPSPLLGSNIVTSVVPYRLVLVTFQPSGASIWRSFSMMTRPAATPCSTLARSIGP